MDGLLCRIVSAFRYCNDGGSGVLNIYLYGLSSLLFSDMEMVLQLEDPAR